MRRPSPSSLERILAALAGVLILRVLARVVGGVGDYFPPDFTSDFLRGREGYFHAGYRWAFYVHILSGPLTLAIGLILVSDTARARSPAWHRRLGWDQVVCVLLLATPSGLWMARHAAAGLATLAIATATCTVMGARAAMRRRFVEHRRWMWRCYLLLSSAIVLRLIGGLATIAEWSAPWLDPLATWASWIVPLTAFECRERWRAGSLPRSIPEGVRVDGLATGGRRQCSQDLGRDVGPQE